MLNQIKMNRSATLSVFLVALLAFMGCSKPDCGCDDLSDHPVLFQYDYINHAWGYNHHGFLIEGNGDVHGFLRPSNWVFPDSAGRISKIDLLFNLEQCDTLYTTLDKKELKGFYDQISQLRNGKIEDTGVTMNDAGIGTLSAWYWNETAKQYENVFLVSKGDSNKINTAALVPEIVDWLVKIGEETDRFFWFKGI